MRLPRIYITRAFVPHLSTRLFFFFSLAEDTLTLDLSRLEPCRLVEPCSAAPRLLGRRGRHRLAGALWGRLQGAAVVSGSSPGSSSSFHGNFARSPGFRRTQEQSPRILLRCCCRCCWIPLGRLWTATPFRIHSQVSMIPRYSPNLKTGSLKDDSFVGITGRRLQGFGQRTRKIRRPAARTISQGRGTHRGGDPEVFGDQGGEKVNRRQTSSQRCPATYG
ncbi:uncharacterized protein LOC105839384 isoform X3 [Monomorium pharaonis]|uniref:uncharacterized protein LOC105839384 isoform X3 n=1 Tax=Monomorium pharaonis TaxID=307658 RepID=UPI001746A944|nr:uncharacterized protein LOC105839384 isoform X3 [Monomorium pharaonis]